VIESLKNPKVKALKKLLTKKEREKTKRFMVEGFHLVEEALNVEAVVELVITPSTTLPAEWDIDAKEVTCVTEEIFKELSDTETPQGILAVCKQPVSEFQSSFQRVLLIDAVQDPGNLGTIIRTADAANLDAVILGKGTVDVFNSKVIRSTQGSIFHIPIVKRDLTEMIQELKQLSIPVYGTSLQNSTPYRDVERTNSFAIIVGNEGNGVSQEVLKQTDHNLYIPIYGKAESLNVAIAAGILMYHFAE